MSMPPVSTGGVTTCCYSVISFYMYPSDHKMYNKPAVTANPEVSTCKRTLAMGTIHYQCTRKYSCKTRPLNHATDVRVKQNERISCFFANRTKIDKKSSESITPIRYNVMNIIMYIYTYSVDTSH